MGARFELQARIDSFSFDKKGDEGIAAQSGRLAVEDLDLPVLLVRIVLVHPEKVAREDVGLVASSGTANLHQDVPLVVLVLGKELELKVLLGLFQFRFQFLKVGLGHLADIGIAVLEHFPIVPNRLLHRLDSIVHLHRGRQAGPFLRQGRQGLVIPFPLREDLVDVLQALLHRLQSFHHVVHCRFPPSQNTSFIVRRRPLEKGPGKAKEITIDAVHRGDDSTGGDEQSIFFVKKRRFPLFFACFTGVLPRAGRKTGRDGIRARQNGKTALCKISSYENSFIVLLSFFAFRERLGTFNNLSIRCSFKVVSHAKKHRAKP